MCRSISVKQLRKTHMLSDKKVENLVVITKFHLRESGYYAGKQPTESSLPNYRNIRIKNLVQAYFNSFHW